MTTLKSKQSEKKGTSTAHYLSESGSDSESVSQASSCKANSKPLIQSPSTEQNKSKKKKAQKNSSDPDDGCIITGETILLDEATLSQPTGNQKSSRKRKRIEDVTGPPSDCEITGETILLQETSPAPKPPKSKKRKFQEAESSHKTRVSAKEPVAGPSGTNVQPSAPETRDRPHNTSVTEGDLDSSEQTYFIDPQEAALLYEDITENDEIWVIQCPKFVNPELLIGNSFNLSKKSAVKCKKNDGSNIQLDSYPVNANAESSKINLLLPSQEEEILKIKVANLQGKLILTEQVEVPEIDYEALRNSQPEEISFPSNLKVRHPLLGLDIPKGRSVSLKQKKLEAEKLNASSRMNSSAATYDLLPSQECFLSLSSANTTAPSGFTSLSEAHYDELDMQTDSQAQHAEIHSKSKKKKRKHAEISTNDIEIKTEWPTSENENLISSSQENYESPVKDYSGSSQNACVDQFAGAATVTVEGNSPISSKKKKKKHKETNIDETDTSHLELKDEPRDSIELNETQVEELHSSSKKKKKKRKEVIPDEEDSNVMGDLSFELKNEPRDPLEVQENIDESLVKSKKKKKKHRENISNAAENFDTEFKQEPVDPPDTNQDYTSDNHQAVSTSKKKKKRREHMESEMVEKDIKTEPADPLALDMDPPVHESPSSSKKKRKRHEGIMLSDSTILPVVCKSEWDSQESSIEEDDVTSHRSKKKSKKRSKTMDDGGFPIIPDENQCDRSLNDSNCDPNDESNHKIKKKKKHSRASADTNEISYNPAEFSDETAALSLGNSGKSKKKKRKSHLDESEDRLLHPSSIKVETIDLSENEAEFTFSLFGAADSNHRLSFMDTLANNYEFGISDGAKSKSKKRSL
ncbi:unnamed protein product [Bemisia tabaci]|uniref:Uncharacterized protein n=1 Tax=Bemisia tabaci TaxID=7038 RepID=A0A9P0A186_BEMTA|nr:unnamed protein product [Bemisia tabaci]